MIPERRETILVTMQIDNTDCQVRVPVWELRGEYKSTWVKCLRYENYVPVSEHTIPVGLFTDFTIGEIKTGGHTYRFKGKIE